jgi:hypothetical protein
MEGDEGVEGSASISTIRRGKNHIEVAIPCNYSSHLKATVPLPDV